MPPRCESTYSSSEHLGIRCDLHGGHTGIHQSDVLTSDIPVYKHYEWKNPCTQPLGHADEHRNGLNAWTNQQNKPNSEVTVGTAETLAEMAGKLLAEAKKMTVKDRTLILARQLKAARVENWRLKAKNTQLQRRMQDWRSGVVKIPLREFTVFELLDELDRRNKS